MRDTEGCIMEYMGYVNPENEEEVLLEILGLELAVKTAEQRIAILRQGLQIAKMKRDAANYARALSDLAESNESLAEAVNKKRELENPKE